MTVVRLADGSLFVHSPVRLDPMLRQQLSQLGTPRYIVPPNKLHLLYIGDYQPAYDTVLMYGARGLAQKRPDLVFHSELQLDGFYP